MKILGVIPARFNSSRFEGKPLANICGRPMIWWVYQHAKQVMEFDTVFVATDDQRIADVCAANDMAFIFTSDRHANHISRIHEISCKMNADLYVCINGDEPAISSDIIRAVIPKTIVKESIIVRGLVRDFKDPAEVIDFSNIKIALNAKGEAIYMSRATVPYPRGTLDFAYNKYVGVECFNKTALDFFVSQEKGLLENIEDIDHLRFIENGIRIEFSKVESDSISVDTPKDLERVSAIIKKRLDAGEITR
jgi:3-deoxy-manno-octulosonate cytidylyltransferase (CMP-KDO synthetase)